MSAQSQIPGVSIAVLKHLQAPNVVLVHHHIAHGEGVQILHPASGRSLHHADELATQLQRVHFEVDLEQHVRHGEDGDAFRAGAVLCYRRKALGQVVQ